MRAPKITLLYLILSSAPSTTTASDKRNEATDPSLRKSKPSSSEKCDIGHGMGAMPNGKKRFLIKLNRGRSDARSRVVGELVAKHGGEREKQFRNILPGYIQIDAKAIPRGLVVSGVVESYEEDKPYCRQQLCGTSEKAWGIDRINQADLPLDVKSGLDDKGAKVTVYVLDDGVDDRHEQFIGFNPSNPSESRVIKYFDCVDKSGDCTSNGTHSEVCTEYNDYAEHGTFIAGTCCGNTVGVPPGSKVVAIRVANCRGQNIAGTDILAGFNAAKGHCENTTHNNGGRCVIAMPIVGPFSPALDNAVTNTVTAGIPVVVAAGNYANDRCDVSPANSSKALVVASSNIDDTLSSWSNTGDCVDLIAPGSSIWSSFYRGDSTTTYGFKSGTSVSCAHAAGAAANYLSANLNASPDDLKVAFQNNSVKNITEIPLLFMPNGCDCPPGYTDNISGNCVLNCGGANDTMNVSVEIIFDDYPVETSWDIRELRSGSLVERDGSGTNYTEEFTLNNCDHVFTIYDEYNDGICCGYGNGSYTVVKNGVVIGTGGHFNSQDRVLITFEAPSSAPSFAPTEAPSSSPTVAPTEAPSSLPSVLPTEAPSSLPSVFPTEAPSSSPSVLPTETPTSSPSATPTKAPITPSPTKAPVPTDSPTKAPVPTDSPTEPPTPFCFSSETMVNVKDKGLVPIGEVEIGEVVQSKKNGGYSKVWALHRDDSKEAVFQQIHTNSGAILELTLDHMLFLADRTLPIPASQVQVGDFLEADSMKLGTEQVVEVNQVIRKGFYDPCTEDGTIVASGIVASNFAAKGSYSPYYDKMGLFHYHVLTQVVTAPTRFVCKEVWWGFCACEDFQNEEELHYYLVFLKYLRSLNDWMQVILFPFVFGFCLFFYTLELCFICSVPAFATGILAMPLIIFILKGMASKKGFQKQTQITTT